VAAPKTVLLFDIDGTLITTGGVGRKAILRALANHGAHAGAAFSFAGMTDRAIVRRALGASDMASDESTIDGVLAHYVTALAEEVAAADPEHYIVHPGVHAALDATADLAHVACGLGTGNIEIGARIKLGRVSLSQRFSFGGFGCDSELRPELIRAGADRGAALLGLPRDQCRVVVIGDTPKDIDAAKAIGAESLAVATGSYDHEQLSEHGPTWTFANLEAPGALDALLGEAPLG